MPKAGKEASMQLGGIKGGHDRDSHLVTGCMHEHAHYRKEKGGAASSSAMSAQSFQMQKQQQDAQFSLSAWVQKLLGRGKGFVKGIWGTGEVSNPAEPGEKSGQAQVMAQMREDAASDSRSAEAKTRVMQENPYFLTMPENRPGVRLTPIQRIRAKVKGVTGQLAGKLPGHFFRFQARNSFQAKPEQRPKEDLRKRSKYRKDELEIDCILTDESYLMDSYDRKGEYSQLTTRK